MTTEDKFNVLKERLEKAVKEEERDNILAVLDLINKEKHDMTLQLLKKTRLGVPVGKLTKHEDADVCQQAKNIISEWKKLTTAAGATTTTTASSPNSENKTESKKTASKRPSEASIQSTPSKRAKKSSEDKPAAAPEKASTDDKIGSVRKKFRDFLLRALSKEKPAEGETFLFTAEEAADCLEQAVFDKHGGVVNEDYMGHMRMLFLNLDHQSRSDLRRDVLDTEDIRAWANMSSEQLMTAEQREEIKKNVAERLRTLKGVDPLANVPEGINQCHRCGSRRIAIEQLQTRGADEPMTIFYTCAECKKRWRT